MKLLEFIADAFANRPVPHSVVTEDHPPSEIYDDALAFQGKHWQDITCSDLTRYTDAPFGFTPEAFCYFLPGIYSAGIRENQPDLLVNSSLIMCLDRSNTPSSWDDFFIVRWPTLNTKECEATQRWLLWLADFQPPVIADTSLSSRLARQSNGSGFIGRGQLCGRERKTAPVRRHGLSYSP
jgi:hypothetical protein